MIMFLVWLWSANAAFVLWTWFMCSRYVRKGYVQGACTDGFYIHIPPEWSEFLAPDELKAIWFHERGHIVHKHIPKNVVLQLVIPMYRSADREAVQEYEADDYAASQGHAVPLAKALLKLTEYSSDKASVHLRAQRLFRSTIGATQ